MRGILLLTSLLFHWNKSSNLANGKMVSNTAVMTYHTAVHADWSARNHSFAYIRVFTSVRLKALGENVFMKCKYQLLSSVYFAVEFTTKLAFKKFFFKRHMCSNNVGKIKILIFLKSCFSLLYYPGICFSFHDYMHIQGEK